MTLALEMYAVAVSSQGLKALALEALGLEASGFGSDGGLGSSGGCNRGALADCLTLAIEALVAALAGEFLGADPGLLAILGAGMALDW